MKFQIEKTSFVRHFQGVMKKIFKFFLTVNQALTKKIGKKLEKIWWIRKVVVPLQSVKRLTTKREEMKDEKIFIKRSEVKRLASIFGVSEVMVYMALRYDRDSELAKKIRHTALKSKADGGCGGEVWKRIK